MQLEARAIASQIVQNRLAMRNPPRSDRPSKIPSLVELAFRQCYSSPELADLPGLLPDETPPHILQTMHRALEQRDTGGLECDECGETMVTPAAQVSVF